jgi:hypothetical protein
MGGRMRRCLDWNETIPLYGTPLIPVERFKTSLHVSSTVSIMDTTTDFCSITDIRTNMFYGRIVFYLKSLLILCFVKLNILNYDWKLIC